MGGGVGRAVGLARLVVGHFVVVGDEDGDEECAQDGAGSEQEGGAGDEGLLREYTEKVIISN